jgi:hypothetical protein
MGLAVVRSMGTARSMRTVTDLEDLEQELVDQYCLAMAGAGTTDRISLASAACCSSS